MHAQLSPTRSWHYHFSFFFFQQFWSWSCTASTTTQCLILSDLISFLNFRHQSDIYLPKWWVELSSSSRETIDFFLLQFKKKFMITLDSSQSSIWAVVNCKQIWLMGRFCSSWKNVVHEICLLKLKHCVFIDLSVQFLRQKGGKTSKWGYNLYLLLLGYYVSNSIYLYL